jgi:8-oxo-dGTP pyrophosphatase MutT (NUDIX family)
MPAASQISLTKAKSDKLFYVVANAIVYRQSDQRCLLLKRSDREVAHPGKYGVIGGKLEWADLNLKLPSRTNGDVLDFENAIEKLLQREAKEEAGIDISGPLRYINSVAYVRPDGVPSILIKFAAQYQEGDVVLEERSFSQYTWANAQEAQQLPCIEGIAEEVAQAATLFS